MGRPGGSPWPEALPPARGGPPPRRAHTNAGTARAGRSHRHCYVLDFQVLIDALDATLAAEAGGLDAAERRRGVGHHALVEPDHAGLQLLADAERSLEVVRIDVGDEPVLGVVGGSDRSVFIVEPDYGRDGPEDLFLEQARVRVDVA